MDTSTLKERFQVDARLRDNKGDYGFAPPPLWAADGRHVAAQDGTGIVIVTVDSGETVRVLSSGVIQFVAGGRYLLVRDEECSRSFTPTTIDPDSGEAVPGMPFAVAGRWSPDGASAAYFWQKDGESDVRIASLDGTTPDAAIAVTGFYPFPLGWSSDSQILDWGSFPLKPEGEFYVGPCSGFDPWYRSSKFFRDARVVVNTGDDDRMLVREGPGLDKAVIDRAENGTDFVIAGGPVEADGKVWWEFASGGWAAGENLELVPDQ